MQSRRKHRQHDFFFSPRDYLNDPAVLCMGLAARGAYSTLLFALWDQREPGIAPPGDAALAALARATPEEWAEVRGQVGSAFTRNSHGAWVQKRMVAEHRRQQSYYALRSRLGKAGRDKQLSGRARAKPGPAPGASQATQATQAEEEDSKDTPLPIADGRSLAPSGNGQDKTDPRAEWDEAFHESFWPAYPRKVKKPPALRAWRALRPWSQEHLDSIYDGLGRWNDYWRDRGTPKDKIPYPATFLNGHQHEDEPQ